MRILITPAHGSSHLNGVSFVLRVGVWAFLTTALLSGCAARSRSDVHQGDLSLPYWDFDQTSAGWRSLADKREFRKAAILIETYLPRHPELLPNQQAMLHFHAAQLFGFEADNREALHHLKYTSVPDYSTGFPARWNDYVAATRAFLQRDHAGLLAARDRMARSLSSEQDQTYLGVVDLLISRWEESYRSAYLSQMEKH